MTYKSRLNQKIEYGFSGTMIALDKLREFNCNTSERLTLISSTKLSYFRHGDARISQGYKD